MHEVRCLASPRQGGSLFLVALLVIQKREKRKEFLVFFKRHLIRQPVADTFSHWRRLAKILAFVSAQTSPRPPLFFSGRADNACTNLLGFFVRYVRTRGIVEVAESGKTADFRSAICRTHSPRMARATNSCTPHEVRKEDGVSPPC